MFGASLKLGKYLQKVDPQCVQIINRSDSDLKYSKQVRYLLDHVLVISNSWSEDQYLPSYLKLETIPYEEFINGLMIHLMYSQKDNVLTGEFKKGLLDTYSPNNFYSPNVSFRSNYMKLPGWHCLFHSMERVKFIHLIQNCSAFVCGLSAGSEKRVQLFGPRVTFPKERRKKLNNSLMMYRLQEESSTSCRIFVTLSRDLLNKICPGTSSRSVPKRLRSLHKVLKSFLINDRRINYASIRLKLNKKSSTGATPVQLVSTLVKEMLGLLFPQTFWGLQLNKLKLLLAIEPFLEALKTDKFSLNQLFQGLSITSFTWAGRSNNVTSQQDFSSRKELVENVLQWVFLTVVCRVVGKFWYVTMNPQGPSFSTNLLAFYPHDLWNSQALSWLSSYKEKYLSRAAFNGNGNNGERLNSGRMRLLPKSGDFRLISVPLKDLGIDDPEKKYQHYARNIVGPVRDLLYHKLRLSVSKRRINHPVCISSDDVLDQIKKYRVRKGLTTKRYYMMKFDMAKCYDNLDQKKIAECVDRLFKDDPTSFEYYMRVRIHSGSSSGSSHLRRFSRITDSTSINLLQSKILDPYSVHEDASLCSEDLKTEEHLGQTIKMTKKQVLEFVQDQVRNARVLINEGSTISYLRKQGVFQGFPLLAVLCHIVYTMMMHDVFSFILKDPLSVLLRVVDDFLLVTTNESLCFLTLNAADSELAKSYGAYLNKSKSVIAEEGNGGEISFLGLKFRVNPLQLILEAPEIGEFHFSENKSIGENVSSLTSFYKHKLKVCLRYKSICSNKVIFAYLFDLFDMNLKVIRRDLHLLLIKGSRKLEIAAPLNHFLLRMYQESCSIMKSLDDGNLSTVLIREFNRLTRQNLAGHEVLNIMWATYWSVTNN